MFEKRKFLFRNQICKNGRIGEKFESGWIEDGSPENDSLHLSAREVARGLPNTPSLSTYRSRISWLFGGLTIRGEREFSFQSISGNEGFWFPFPNSGNGYFHCLLLPKPLWERNFSFPSRSRISEMCFFHSLPNPQLWEWIYFFPSWSRYCPFTGRNHKLIWLSNAVPGHSQE